MRKEDISEKLKETAYETGFNMATGIGPANIALKTIERAYGVPEKARPSNYLSKLHRTSRKVGASVVKKLREKSKES